MANYDFSGYATRNDLLCGDGRTIRKNAFKDNDGCEVPLIWNHEHNDPNADELRNKNLSQSNEMIEEKQSDNDNLEDNQSEGGNQNGI